jgi:pSer/pThr/pTyr-binding forkhead associated (FHA) protein
LPGSSAAEGPAPFDPLFDGIPDVRYCLVCFPLEPIKLEKDRIYDIGRSKKCSMILPVGMVSRRHAIIQWRGSAFVMTDLKSANGTYVNGEAITERSLKNQDKIKIGPYVLDFFVYSGDTAVVGDRLHELEKTQDITIGDPTKNINTFRGNISEMALGEIMQLLNLTRKSGDLVVKNDSGEGTVFFRAGEIVHAVWKNLEGEKAFEKIVSLTGGGFKFSLNDAGVPKTISQSTSRLLVQALRNARRR